MGSAEHDFQHFVRWLHEPEVGASPDARRMGNLVLRNFEAVSATTRNRSQRAIRIVDLARAQYAQMNDGLSKAKRGILRWI